MKTNSNLNKENKKVLLGLSGGVDSTAAALLLKERGYMVTGMFFDVIGDQKAEREKAEYVAGQLNIDFVYKDVSDKFTEIINYFCESYNRGETPNPCIKCNPTIKFATMIEEAENIGADYIATGHYAQVFFDESKQTHFIKKAKFQAKDQSYMLYRLNSDILSKLLLPLGTVDNKEEIRKLVRKYGIVNADDKDSQEICFIKDSSYVDFIKKWSKRKLGYPQLGKAGKRTYLAMNYSKKEPRNFYTDYVFNSNLAEETLALLEAQELESETQGDTESVKIQNAAMTPGNFVDKTGKVLGRHKGIINYTIGQRKGLGITFGKPVFVTKIDHDSNMVTLGEEAELFDKCVFSKENMFLGESFENGMSVKAKIRYGAIPKDAKLKKNEDGTVETTFIEEQRAATPGQSIVFYQNDLVIGGGIII